jgi:hypothetical protein
MLHRFVLWIIDFRPRQAYLNLSTLAIVSATACVVLRDGAVYFWEPLCGVRCCCT